MCNNKRIYYLQTKLFLEVELNYADFLSKFKQILTKINSSVYLFLSYIIISCSCFKINYQSILNIANYSWAMTNWIRTKCFKWWVRKRKFKCVMALSCQQNLIFRSINLDVFSTHISSFMYSASLYMSVSINYIQLFWNVSLNIFNQWIMIPLK